MIDPPCDERLTHRTWKRSQELPGSILRTIVGGQAFQDPDYDAREAYAASMLPCDKKTKGNELASSLLSREERAHLYKMYPLKVR